MTGLQPETPDANTSERNETGRTAMLRVAEAAHVAARHIIELGVADEVAAALRERLAGGRGRGPRHGLRHCPSGSGRGVRAA